MPAAPKKVIDEDGVPLKAGDHLTFTFGIPPTCVTCRLDEESDRLVAHVIHPLDVKPRSLPLDELMRHYQVWKASKARVAAITKRIDGKA
jgi:hypothetical protein